MKAIYFILLACLSVAANCQHQKTSCRDNHAVENSNLIPTKIIRFIRDSLEEFEFPGIRGFDKSWPEYTDSNCPYLCISDFNGDKINDYAFLLINEKHHSVLLCAFTSNKNTYSLHKIKEFKLNVAKIDLALQLEHKGIWESVDERIFIKNDGIVVNRFSESKSFGFYWENGKFRSFLYD